MSEGPQSERTYESYTLQPAAILVAGAALAILIIASFFVVDGVLTPLEERRAEVEKPLHPMAGSRTKPPAPVLQADPYQELIDHAAEVDRRIRTYGWVEQQSGVIHIPVERAMELTVERGLPARRQEDMR